MFAVLTSVPVRPWGLFSTAVVVNMCVGIPSCRLLFWKFFRMTVMHASRHCRVKKGHNRFGKILCFAFLAGFASRSEASQAKS